MNKFVKLLITAFAVVIGLSFTACGDGSGDNGNGTDTPIASFAGTWNASGGRSIVFSGSNFTYKVNGTPEYAGTFSISGSKITFKETMQFGGQSASGNFTLSGTTLTLSNHTWDSSVNGTYTKDSGGGGGGGNAGTYIIMGSGTTFTATKNNATVGTANQTLQTVGNAIRTDANGANCTIQFGNGTNVLDIGTDVISFSGTWGVITITGKITSSGNGTIEINGCSLNSTADIANTRVTSSGVQRGLFNHSGGTVTITSGTINCLVSNGVNGTMIINGGTINCGIRNGSTLTINNGTIVNSSGATIDQTGTTSLGSPITVIVTINGGTIETTGTTSSDYAIRNKGPNTVNIAGGTVRATGSAYAIYNYNGDNGEVGTVTIGAGATIIGNKYGVN